MPIPTKKLSWKSSPSFALISVLALVSLAALTATAFLASARLERQASASIGKTTLVEMALDSGKFCACQIINDYCQPDLGNNHIVTYWRTNRNDELGYPFIGEIKTSGNNNGQRSAQWYYVPLFSPAGVKKLGTNDIQYAMRFTNLHQGTFSNDLRTYMIQATNSFSATPEPTNPICVRIPLLGGRTSPPVGWVYIDQEKRRLGSSLTNTSPALRIAWFTEDLEGLIDAQRMGGTTTRSSGTNSEEISLSSARDTNGAALISDISSFTNQTSRRAYLSYGLLASPSISGLVNSTNARYFASGLRSWRPTNTPSPTNNQSGAVEWIPVGIPITTTNGVVLGYSNQGYTKIDLNRMINNPNALSNIASVITNNLPDFTNRAGGMNGTNYALALAANIIDYADADSTATSTNNNGVNIVGFDSYPMLTQVADRFVYSRTARNITITTYLQFWNPSSVPTPTLTGGTFTYNLNDTIIYTNTATLLITKRPLTNSALANSSFTFGGGPFSFPPNSGYITSIENTIDLTIDANFPNFPTTGPVQVQLNDDGTLTDKPDSAATNSFTLTGLGATNKPPLVLGRGTVPNTLRNGAPNWIVTVLNSRTTSSGDFNGDASSSRYSVDPRMLNYIGIGTSYQMAKATYTNTYWGGYPAQKTAFPAYLSGHPGNWPDSAYSNAVTPNGTNSPDQDTPPTIGGFIIPDPAPCKISNYGSYTNICELGNVFDPIQWVPPTAIINYANCDITTNWTTNTLYGGGSTLRIGRPEHSLFAFTNMGGNSIPKMQMSAAALLDLFCTTNLTNAPGTNSSPPLAGPYNLGAGRINLNTAPAPVLAALAGGIALSRDPNKVGAEVSTNMINAFTNGVMRFRHLYPFLSPSQLLFISANYGDANWTNSAVWSNAAVFSKNQGLAGVTSINDEGREEWFSKMYALSSCQSHNFRIYVVAQLVATNSSGQTNAIGPLVKKYYQVYFQNGSSISYPATNKPWSGTNSTYGTNNNIYTWFPTGTTIDIHNSYY